MAGSVGRRGRAGDAFFKQGFFFTRILRRSFRVPFGHRVQGIYDHEGVNGRNLVIAVHIKNQGCVARVLVCLTFSQERLQYLITAAEIQFVDDNSASAGVISPSRFTSTVAENEV